MKIPLPEASLASVPSLPVSLNRTKSFGIKKLAAPIKCRAVAAQTMNCGANPEARADFAGLVNTSSAV